MVSPGRPPELAGLTFIEPIGTGGFADVYLYQQALPARRVAVKVLREAADAGGMAQFHDEANVMAQLSGHPSIVPIYQADVSPDGRAYLVMEFCPPPHLAQRYRAERIPVPEVLEIAVKISSAVETAHRAGILHRDIKPHNILTSAYGAPLLTDFGIASAAGDANGASYGMSVPWSPPEAFSDPAPLDVRSDVFSLAATVYSLLAGRSPFEIPGAANDSATLIHRIEHQDPSRILRVDVPDPLNELLQRALSKSVDRRPPSAMAFARGIQEIQISLHLTPTRLEVMDASTEANAATAPVEDERTRVRPVAIIVPEEIAERGTRLRPRTVTQVEDRTSLRDRRPAAAPETVQRRPVTSVGEQTGSHPLAPAVPGPDAPPDDHEEPASRTSLLVGSVLALVVAAVVGVAFLAGGTDKKPDQVSGPRNAPTSVFLGSGPSQPTDLKVSRSGRKVVLTWTNPEAAAGDRSVVRIGPSLSELEAMPTSPATTVSVVAARGSQVCYAIRTDRSGAPSPELKDCVIAP